MKKIILIVLALFCFSAHAANNIQPLPAEKAFHFSAHIDQDHQLILEWNIAPGYYLYRNQFKFTPATDSVAQIDKIILPEGLPKHDILHGAFQAYVGSVKLPIALLKPGTGKLNLAIHYQGCSSDGFCYTPIKKTLTVDLSRVVVPQNLDKYVSAVGETKKINSSETDNILKFFEGRNLFFILLAFLGLGLLLAFTPCVLPMVPILSSIIVGHHKKTNKKKSLALSLAYVSGMAITYAIAGVIIALIGSNIQAELQKPWIIVLMSGIFLLLALSLFGFYELQLPARWQNSILSLSHKQKGGTYFGVFLMGCLSTLIVSPCVSAPLVGVLAYIGQTGDVVLGASALLALGIGMGIPLLLLGISADRLLPKAGSWMTTLEKIFGFVMLGFAIWLLSRMIPGPVTLFLWAILCISLAVFFAIYSPLPKLLKWLSQTLAALLFVAGMILILGSVQGNSDFLHPLSYKNAAQKNIFKVVRSMDELNEILAKAKNQKQPVLLDFYADWCNSCVLMDRRVFSREDVQTAMSQYVVLRADVTDNNEFDRKLLARFHIVGPPTVIFFNQAGQELIAARVAGEVNATEFLARLRNLQ